MALRARPSGDRRLHAPLPAGGGAASAATAAAPDPRTADWGPALAFLRPGGRFLLTTHVNPDGDGLGAQAALAHALAQRGCEATVVNADPVPEVLGFLFEGLPPVLGPEQAAAAGPFDGAVILDVSALKRLGAVAGLIAERRLPTLTLDHHLANEIHGGLVYAFPGTGSTGEALAALLDAAGVDWTPAIATAVYTAVVTDSGGFVFASTTAETLELAARLVRAGADPCAINERVNQSHPPQRYDLLARFLASMEVRAGGELLVFELSRAMVAASGARREDSEGFANLGLGVRGCRMTAVFSDLSETETKVNLRCKAPWDVCALARTFGGGGHRFAAGATVAEPLAALRPRLLAAAEAQLAAGREGRWDG